MGPRRFLEKLNRFCLLAHIKKLSFKEDMGKQELIQRRNQRTTADHKQLKELELVKRRQDSRDIIILLRYLKGCP